MSRSAAATQSTVPSGSTTTTQQYQAQIPFTSTHGTLVLRADEAEERHIQWAEDVIDNEGMGKKSSKVCCIYHKPRAVDESSGDDSSDSSSSDSDSDSGADDGRARPVGDRRERTGRRSHDHDHDHKHGDDCGGTGGGQNGGGNGKAKGKGKVRKRSPNAYEKMPGRQKKD